MKSYWVYILLCRDGSYYTGITNDFERRLNEHSEGTDGKCYTVKRRPVRLVYRVEFREVTDAISYEKQVKRWSRNKKEAMINGQEELLHSLATCKNTSHFHFKTINLLRNAINSSTLSLILEAEQRHYFGRQKN